MFQFRVFQRIFSIPISGCFMLSFPVFCLYGNPNFIKQKKTFSVNANAAAVRNEWIWCNIAMEKLCSISGSNSIQIVLIASLINRFPKKRRITVSATKTMNI